MGLSILVSQLKYLQTFLSIPINVHACIFHVYSMYIPWLFHGYLYQNPSTLYVLHIEIIQI